MEWWLVFLIIVGGCIVLMLAGMPIALAFMAINIIGALMIWGGHAGLVLLVRSVGASVSMFALLPVPLFILLGEVIFHAGIASKILDVADSWMGRIRGRLSLLTVCAGTLFGTLSGSSMASIAMLGSTLVPEMERRGYKKPMSLGPILGSGGLSVMIPPSSLGIVLAALAQVPVGGLLIGIIVPGLLMAAFYATYVIVRCQVQPSLAPKYEAVSVSLSEKLRKTARHVLPLAIIIFLVTGVIFLGIATPTEAAATGALGAFILAACYRQLKWQMVLKSVTSSIRVTGMMLFVITGAKAFSQILAFSGASRGLIESVLDFPVSPIIIILAMQLIMFFLGTFMDTFSIIMITIPVFIPIVKTLGFNPLWFTVIMLLNMEMAMTSPPFGLSLFVMKGVAPPGTTMGDVYKAALPFLGCDFLVMVLMLLFPQTVLWLPGMMG